MTRAVLRFTASLCLLAAVAACGQKQSQLVAASSATPSPASAQPQLTPGVVVMASATELAINSSDTPATFQLSPATTIMVAHTGTVADIKPGSFIGTTNVPSADGTGQSTEVHIFPPGVKMGEGDRPMGATPAAPASRMTNGTVSAAAPAEASATRMTNGSVGAVANAPAGLAMDVAYAGGQRHIVVPADTPVMVMSSGTTELLKPGVKVLVGAVPGPNGSRDATFINITP
jgi:hypothetical protein